jgi:xylan 1,4-beta-xylosidase
MMSTTVQNPIFKGFNPDPSFIFVDDTYYIATSTFEWNAGVQIYYSKDLVNWDSVAALEEKRLLNLTGIPSSGGVWAPCLSYNKEEKLFYLGYSNFKSSYQPPFRDLDNFVVTAESIHGPWSDPVRLNCIGYDPFIFHDDDGKSYITHMIWDYREEDKNRSAGIIIQEYDRKEKRLVGKIHKIFEGTELGWTEGPNMYKQNGYYYLLTAEGGPHYEHASTLVRSKSIFGPYEMHPYKHFLTSSGSDCTLQKAGHASICEDADGNWYLAHLCARPVKDGKCVMGRETAIQEVEWREDDWLYLKNGTIHPSDSYNVNRDVEKVDNTKNIYTFEDENFRKDFLTLREPYSKERFSINDREGYLRIYGKESINSVIEQAIICRRQTAASFEAKTLLEFEPSNYGHMAGILYKYNEANQYYFYMTYDETKAVKVLGIMKVDKGQPTLLSRKEQPVIYSNHVYLKLEVNKEKGQFYYSLDDNVYIPVGEVFDTTVCSDEHAWGFTGTMVGMACQDLFMHEHYADFKTFIYEDKCQ